MAFILAGALRKTILSLNSAVGLDNIDATHISSEKCVCVWGGHGPHPPSPWYMLICEIKRLVQVL